MCRYADFNCLKLPHGAMDKILDLTMLSDIFPTGFHVSRRRRTLQQNDA